MTNKQRIFRFKQFSVINNLSGMKVGTDGVLIGAWAWKGEESARILDIGAGCGLISLMMAQRNPSAKICGIEIDADAAKEAEENINSSPWHKRISIIHDNILDYTTDKQYDVIVSNPPFFSNSLICPDNKRTLARHNDQLSLHSLIAQASLLLAPRGKFSFIYPADDEAEIKSIIDNHGMTLSKICRVYTTTAHVNPKRIMCECMHKTDAAAECIAEKLYIEIARHQYTNEYIALTQDFYLNM